MTIKNLVLGRLETNCWILSEPSCGCVIIDPASNAKEIAAAVSDLGPVKYILFTHGHFDHVLGALRLREYIGDVDIYLNPLDEFLLPEGISYNKPLSDGQELPFGDSVIRVMHTPGHTPGSSVFIYGDTIFSGDTLFAGTYGRCDLPGGSTESMKNSLKRLASLEGEYQVLPGHSVTTTLETEKLVNPLMRL